MTTDKRAFTMRMQHENFDKIKFIAEQNKRSIAMQIEFLIENCIAKYESEHGSINIQAPAQLK
nr:MAG TPA: MNT REPRESSOR MUTANT WITH C-TERMINAL REGULATION [Caudoviricetes sp.]